MMGFYKWDGYLEGVQDLTGGPGSNLGSPQAIENSAFVVPVNKEDAFNTWNNNNNTLTTYQTYYKARLGFMSQLIQKINAYSGGLQFSAQFVNYEDAVNNTGQVYKTDTEKDDIYIERADIPSDENGCIETHFMKYHDASHLGVLACDCFEYIFTYKPTSSLFNS